MYAFTDTCCNEGFEDPQDTPHPLATTREKYLWGLYKGPGFSNKNVTIREVTGRDRSAFANRSFKSGDFVCEYRGVVRQRTSDKDWVDQRNASLGLGCYCLDVTFENEAYTIDATASINDPGRYINHASRNYNLLLMPPVKIGKPPNAKLRIGFVAKRDVRYGEELFFHYGLKNDPDLPWIAKMQRKLLLPYKNKKFCSSPEQGNST